MHHKEDIQKIHQELISGDIPFVIYKLPGENQILLEIGQKSGLEEFLDLSEVWKEGGFLIVPFHAKTGKKRFILHPIRRVQFELNSVSVKTLENNSYPIDNQKITYNYKNQIETYKSAFSTDFKKAILSKMKEIRVEAMNNLEYFIKIAKKYPSAFVYYLQTEETGTWLGASPETLISSKSGKVEIMSLAGTSKTGTWTEKEVDEQQYVSDFILQKLKKYQITNFSQSETQNLKAGNIFHLMTKFQFESAQLKNNLSSFIEELHPTPAVCGLPKEDALELILQTEDHNREYYTGFLGPYRDQENFHFFVNLRCLKRVGEKLQIFVGGGITQDSQAQSEWDETEEKAKTLLGLL